MIYKKFQDLQLSALGMGCMRFPTAEGKDDQIDECQTAKMIAQAFDGGVNYFDTAWFYHGGNSETVLGKMLKEYPRDSFYMATKFPGIDPEHGRHSIQQVFERQLEKCQVEYFDFYLYHNVSDGRIDMMLDPKYGIHEYLMEQKRLGRIRHLGFSTHGSLSCMKRFLDALGSDLEFCQIQLNWLDWKLQNAREKVELLNHYNIPIWVMEPVRGGRLVTLPEEDIAKLKELRSGVTTPEWAFRFLQGVPGVTMVLSGMSNEQQLAENLETFSEHKPLNDEELAVTMEIAERMIAKNTVPCTGCNYCVEHCPVQIPIPAVIKAYNEKSDDPGTPGPFDCIACGNCRVHCPQGIHIPGVMKDYAAKL